MGVVLDQTSDELAAALEAVTVDPPGAPERIAPAGRDVFEAQSGEVVRPDHAVKCVEAPDDLVFFGYEDTSMFVASKATEPPGKPPFSLLAIGGDKDGLWSVDAGYRVYPEAGEGATTLAGDARRVLQLLLERYGLPYKAGDRWVRFVPVVTQRPNKNGDMPVMEVAPPADSPADYVMNGQMRKNRDGTMTIAWPFAINITAYRRDVRRHQNA